MGAKTHSYTTSGFGLATIVTAAIWIPTAGMADGFRDYESDSEINSLWLSDDNRAETASDFSEEILVSETSVLVRQLQIISGLTNKELGNVFQVSRRSIHNWANGSSISSENENRVREFYYLVSALGVDTSEQRRSLLFSSAHGESLIEKFMSDGKKHQQLQHTISVVDRLG